MPQAVAPEADFEPELTGNQNQRAERRVEHVFDASSISVVRI